MIVHIISNYVTTIISWCAGLPGAYVQVNALNPLIAWIYYTLLAGVTVLLVTRWKPTISFRQRSSAPQLSKRRIRVVQTSLALLAILTTGAWSIFTPPDGHLSLTLLTDNDPAQGKALLLRSPDGQTALINEGASGSTLAHSLDAQLPFWQRSLHLMILPSASANNLSGLQDITGRYQISQTVDAGMLHPTIAYARWRTTLDERHQPYTRVRQGAIISLGSQVRFQVLWPLNQLHKSSNEESDNALIVRLIAPGLRILFLNAAALSEYALKTLVMTLPPDLLQAEIVQLAGEAQKNLPRSLSTLLSLAHPSLLLITSTPARKSQSVSKADPPSTTLSTLTSDSWQVLQTQNIHSLQISSTARGWDFHF